MSELEGTRLAAHAGSPSQGGSFFSDARGTCGSGPSLPGLPPGGTDLPQLSEDFLISVLQTSCPRKPLRPEQRSGWSHDIPPQLPQPQPPTPPPLELSLKAPSLLFLSTPPPAPQHPRGSLHLGVTPLTAASPPPFPLCPLCLGSLAPPLVFLGGLAVYPPALRIVTRVWRLPPASCVPVSRVSLSPSQSLQLTTIPGWSSLFPLSLHCSPRAGWGGSQVWGP